MVNAMRHTVFNSCSASQKKMIVAVGISLIDYGSQGSWATRHEHISCSFMLCQFLLKVFEQLSEQRWAQRIGGGATYINLPFKYHLVVFSLISCFFLLELTYLLLSFRLLTWITFIRNYGEIQLLFIIPWINSPIERIKDGHLENSLRSKFSSLHGINE